MQVILEVFFDPYSLQSNCLELNRIGQLIVSYEPFKAPSHKLVLGQVSILCTAFDLHHQLICQLLADLLQRILGPSDLGQGGPQGQVAVGVDVRAAGTGDTGHHVPVL